MQNICIEPEIISPLQNVAEFNKTGFRKNPELRLGIFEEAKGIQVSNAFFKREIGSKTHEGNICI